MAKTVTRRNSGTGSVLAQAHQFLAVRAEAEALTARADVLKKRLMSWLEENGEEDDKKHRIFRFPSAIEAGGKEFNAIKRERRASSQFDEARAKEILHTKGLLDRAQRYVVTLTLPFNPEGQIVRLREGQVWTSPEAEQAIPVDEAEVDVETTLDQNEIYVLNQEGLLSDEDLDEILVEKITFAFKPVKD